MITRRDFMKGAGGGAAALMVGSMIPGVMDNPLYAATPVEIINFRITDAVKDMVTHNPGHSAQCYFWVYKEDHFSTPDCPGPIIFTRAGSVVEFVITNDLDEPHCLSIPRLHFTTGPIAPGATVTKKFRPSRAGTYLYYDNLNEPVNRMMGLHGAFIVMPKVLTGTTRKRVTPFTSPPPHIQRLFNDLGQAPWWPGLAWEEGDPASDTVPFRQYVWVLHEASPTLFSEVGNFTPGQNYPAADFVQKFLHDPFNPTPGNHVPQYFTVSGQSGHFSHNNPYICPYSRVGEPVIIRILNAGLWLHSTHIHANHVYVLSHNNLYDPVPGQKNNSLWIDVYSAEPLATYEWLVPYMRPPDVPNDIGIGRDDLEAALDVTASAVPMLGFGMVPASDPPAPADIPANPVNPYFPGTHTTWPAIQELQTFIPQIGNRIAFAQDGVTPIDCAVMLSPMCFPMHDHSEASQTSQGGNYNCGMICGIVFTGDRKGARPGGAGVLTFDMRPPEKCPDYTQGVVPPTVEFVVPSIPM